MRTFFHTFGCKANQYDTELLRAQMESAGAYAVASPAEAELCLVNSCSVTARADQECRQFVRRLLRESPRARIVVTGCYPSHAPQELTALSPRVEVYSNKDKASLPACLGFEVAPEVWGLARFAGRARAFVKIQDGCRAACRYCIIPQTRPDYWSKPAGEVVTEVARLAENGHGEIVFTGIRLGLYRWRGEGRIWDLPDLLEELLRLPGEFRIRLSSLEVTEVSDRLIGLAVRRPERICPHFHIPLQSADDGVLKDMGRWYGFRDYEERVHAIRQALPHAAVTADVLTAFPTETEAAFATTHGRIESLALAGLHAFPFSARPKTPAAALAALPGEVVHERTRRLLALSGRLTAAFRARFAGQSRTALPEAGGLGWTDNYIRVRAGGPVGRLAPALVSAEAP